MNLIRVERLKMKRSMFSLLGILCPLCTAGLAMFAGGLVYYQVTGLYWWYIFVLQGFVSVACFFALRIEERSKHDEIIYSLPVCLWKVRMAKNLMIAKRFLITNGILMICLWILPNVLFPLYVHYSPGELFLGILLMGITSLWQIPFCLLFMRKCGLLLPMIVHALLGIVSTVVIGTTSFWFLWPYCYTAKTMERVMGIGINGTMEDVSRVGTTECIVAVVLSVALYAGLSLLDARLFHKGGDTRK